MVHREEHNEGFTIIDNAVLLNVNLSWEARGFLVFLLSLPDDWNFNIKGLVSQTGTKKDVILRLVKELAEKEGITETLKAKNQMLWVQRMNEVRETATKTVNNDLIYT